MGTTFTVRIGVSVWYAHKLSNLLSASVRVKGNTWGKICQVGDDHDEMACFSDEESDELATG